jgi:hypothetical protein
LEAWALDAGSEGPAVFAGAAGQSMAVVSARSFEYTGSFCFISSMLCLPLA